MTESSVVNGSAFTIHLAALAMPSSSRLAWPAARKSRRARIANAVVEMVESAVGGRMIPGRPQYPLACCCCAATLCASTSVTRTGFARSVERAKSD